jgi:hypothetical protein
MNDDLLIKYIENEYENEFLDFKIKPYNWKETKSKANFLSDVISLANSSSKIDRYIILGVKIKSDGTRNIDGIDTKDLVDSAEYQQLVSENIEPDLSIELNTIKYNNMDFGIIRIFNCDNRPYLLKKKYDNLESGYIKIRKGSRNTNLSRYILDDIYSSKVPKLESKFKIFGLKDGKKSEKIRIVKYDFFPDMKLEKDELLDLLNKINNYNIDDVISVENESNSHTNFLNLKQNMSLSEKEKIDEDIIDNIKSFAKVFKVNLNDNFFDIGDLTKVFAGVSHTGFGITSNYKIEGSKKSKDKYNLIIELNEKLNRIVSWLDFIDKTKNFGYIELIISELGNTTDEEIEVNIEIPKNNYINYEDFPSPNQNIVDELNENYSEKMFKPYYSKDISDFRKMPLSSMSHIPSTTFNPLYGKRIEFLEGLYDYIDYDVTYNKDYATLNFTIKSLKEGESMIFPGKILINGNIDKLTYSIISKKSNKKISGTLNIANEK